VNFWSGGTGRCRSSRSTPGFRSSTRCQEVTGIDLVRECRIADGQELGYTDPEPRGHSIEFRINAEDPGRNFLPAPGTITELTWPSGPGVRVDAGYAQGMTVPQAFDSLLAKLIITGASRTEALERARRALDECVVGGMPTVLPFDRVAVVRHRSAVRVVHTRWIETEFRRDQPWPGPRPARKTPAAASGHRGGRRQAARCRPAGLGRWPGPRPRLSAAKPWSRPRPAPPGQR
jgi:acetyl-CoA/propionyl-CoA carboxylase biotin carboxyl carrier protein